MKAHSVAQPVIVYPYRVTSLGYIYCGHCCETDRPGQTGPVLVAADLQEIAGNHMDPELYRSTTAPGGTGQGMGCDECGLGVYAWPGVESEGNGLVEYPECKIY